jgi:hypothetical protein
MSGIVKNEKPENLDDVCSICLSKLSENGKDHSCSPDPTLLTCSHAFHFGCIGEWFVKCERFECPVCRKQWQLKSLHQDTSELPPVPDHFDVTVKRLSGGKMTFNVYKKMTVKLLRDIVTPWLSF